jgi:hypothetical protein
VFFAIQCTRKCIILRSARAHTKSLKSKVHSPPSGLQCDVGVFGATSKTRAQEINFFPRSYISLFPGDHGPEISS